jgi:hypothetical protein
MNVSSFKPTHKKALIIRADDEGFLLSYFSALNFGNYCLTENL